MTAALQRAEMRNEVPDPDPVRCEAFVLREDEEGDNKLSVLRKNIMEWISWQGECELRRHSYCFKTESGGNIFTIRHVDCQQQVVVKDRDDVPICAECQKIGDQNGIRRTVLKHVRKKFAAELLHAKLFVSDERVEQMKSEMKKHVIYKPHNQFFDTVMDLRTHELQTWVRKSFLCMTEKAKSAQFRNFMDTTVEPCMRINVHAALQTRPQIVQAQTLFTNFLEKGDPAIVDRINVEIAQASLSGKLQNHPLLQGLILSCLKMLDREERGLQMVGRDDESSLQFTEEARYLVQEAGSQLAILGCNKHILQKFGLRCRPQLPDLTDSGLPTPMLALQTAEAVRDNMILIDQRLSAATETSGCDPSRLITFSHLFWYIYLGFGWFWNALDSFGMFWDVVFLVNDQKLYVKHYETVSLFKSGCSFLDSCRQNDGCIRHDLLVANQWPALQQKDRYSQPGGGRLDSAESSKCNGFGGGRHGRSPRYQTGDWHAPCVGFGWFCMVLQCLGMCCTLLQCLIYNTLQYLKDLWTVLNILKVSPIEILELQNASTAPSVNTRGIYIITYVYMEIHEIDWSRMEQTHKHSDIYH